MQSNTKVVVAVLFALVLIPVFGWTDPSAEVRAIVTKYTAALGGEEAIRKVKTRVTTGIMEIPNFGVVAAPYEVKSKAPNKTLSRVEIETFGIIHNGFDGRVSWKNDPNDGIVKKSKDELADDKRFQPFYRMADLHQIYSDLSLKGDSDVEGSSARVIEAKTKDGRVDRLHFSVESGLLIREERNQTAPGSDDFKVTLNYSDYRSFDGIKYPCLHRITISSVGLNLIFKIEKIEHDTPIDDKIFRKP